MKSPMTPRTLELFKQASGNNGVLDLIAPEVFYQIMVYLEPKDIRTCMCVSKKWKVCENRDYTANANKSLRKNHMFATNTK